MLCDGNWRPRYCGGEFDFGDRSAFARVFASGTVRIQGDSFDGAALAGALAVEQATIEERLDALAMDHGLVRFAGELELSDATTTRCYRFIHVWHRSGMLASLAPARRTALEAAIASAFVQQRRSGREA